MGEGDIVRCHLSPTGHVNRHLGDWSPKIFSKSIPVYWYSGDPGDKEEDNG